MDQQTNRDRRSFDLRRRAVYLAASATTLLLGLASRLDTDKIPRFLAIHAGDALWAAMIYWLIRLVAPGKRAAFGACCALLLSFAVEFSQLYRADWIDGLRGTTLGALVLGRVFLLADLVRYLIGILCAFVLDIGLSRRKTRPNIENRDRNR